MTVTIVLSQAIPQSTVVRAIPFLLLGTILASFKLEKKSTLFTIGTLLLVFFYLIFGARIIRVLGYSYIGFTVKLTLIAIIFYFVMKMKVSKRCGVFFTALGKRSYVFYAIHAPIIQLENYLFQPRTISSLGLYLLALVTTSLLVTEVVYRLIEKPAIKFSARIRAI